jgi:hypothetical protein
MSAYVLLQDDNRYSAGRGAHLNLKRAEKARVLVQKIPSESSILQLDTLVTSCNVLELTVFHDS